MGRDNKNGDVATDLRELADKMSAERIDRLIASNESATNAINRLVQVLERKENKAVTRAARVRRVPTRKVAVSDKAEAVAKAAIARIRGTR